MIRSNVSNCWQQIVIVSFCGYRYEYYDDVDDPIARSIHAFREFN